MSRYILIRRLRGPAFLLLIGVLALLNQADILTWGKSWPLYLILAGVLLLAERAALAAAGPVPQTPFPGAPYPGPVNPAAPQAQPRTETGVSIIPAGSGEIVKGPEGGQS